MPVVGRKNDPVGLKNRIFHSALTEFAESGLNGARMEKIAEQAGTTKRMVVYHFKNKETLYINVLEHVYSQIRQHEVGLNLATLPPAEALVRLVEASFNFHVQNADFIRIICMENMMRGRYIRQSTQIKALNRSALTVLEDILSRGKASGLFKADVAARDVHRLISSLSFHQAANQYTFDTLFEGNSQDENYIAHFRRMAVQVTLRFVTL
ncbi:TetR family transcriptional regulator [Nissabacter sp. SGAir0207]|uniref:TetR family transcriptional regulator n=1 Tax=Nissabacter sp. SGAir0207 TaxID=2126321 RepID=UPI0010CD3772|nr:TetR family transcriptional regulator [Nissabacter sp. SGAir0207]QCR37737.1 TetR family transcriptional regulator [Nissabacter sp. SGAir0207]